jgi:purine nucleosidase
MSMHNGSRSFSSTGLPLRWRDLEMKEKIILDVDTSTGIPAQEIDDGIAIALALASPEIEVLGCTTCAGNCRTRLATVNTLRILELAGRSDIPVAEGRHAPLLQDARASLDACEARSQRWQDHWKDMPPLPAPTITPSPLKAHEFIIETVKKYPGEVTVVKEGSLTNLALALLVAPEIAPLVKGVVHMGGSIGEPGWATVDARDTPDTPSYLWRHILRFNTQFDPDATEIVIRAGIRFCFVTDTVTRRVFLRPEHLHRLEAIRTPYHAFLADTARPWIRWQTEVRGRPGAMMHDALALAVLMDPTLCTCVPMRCDLPRFRRSEYPYLYASPDPPHVSVAVDVEAERFEEFLISRLATPLTNPP